MEENFEVASICGVSCYEKDGTAYLRLDDVARGLGFTQMKNGIEYVKWERVDNFLRDIVNSPVLGKRPEFIPENIFYRLAMKAKNETAEKFQALVADKIIPSIRKTGGYIAGQEQMTDLELLAQANLVSQRIIAERDKRIASLVSENEDLSYENKELKPKAEFADAITASDDAIPMAVFAKILCQNGILIDGRKPGQNILFENLRRTGYLCANKGRYWNTPQQCFVKMGYFKIDEGLNPFGGVRYTTRITPKGQKYFIRLFKRIMDGEEV